MYPYYLYHYSDQPRDEIKTKRAQGTLTDKDRKIGEEEFRDRSEIAPYFDCVSFFFDPIPAQLLPTIYGNHRSWKKGTVLYEHTIDVKLLEHNVKYNVTESELQTEFMDKWFSDRNEKDFKNDEEMKDYYRQKDALARAYGEKGQGVQNLMVQTALYKGRTEGYFRKVSQRPDFAEVKELYAAYVPHVEVCTESGIIIPKSILQLAMGANQRYPVRK